MGSCRCSISLTLPLHPESPSSSTGSDQATFYYQPDEADDFDDEDPDEDLDI